MPIPLIIDTDPGIDDALAIALACGKNFATMVVLACARWAV